ncbi:MAG: pyruvate dehydrogenase complex dihydrolipoamide acetyltransferase [Alphaproteobacteria bacterium]|nr:pyruvate dehydrogenase complex dihydrolipoamide acetyltransferase [Alphaproteobacteria bacterium]
MPIEITMPALSPTMTEGNLAKWTKKEGDKIKAGDVIAEIETDKATMEVEAVDEGTLGKIVVAAGTEGVKVNAVIALILADGEDKKALADWKPKQVASSQSPVASEAKKEVGAPQLAPVSAAPTLAPSASKAPAAPIASAAPAYAASAGGRVKASPLAKRLAASKGIDLSGVVGSGPGGRIVKADIEAGAGRSGAGAIRRNPTEFVQVPNNSMRKVIARRLLESKQQVPHFYLTVEVELDALMAVRAQLNADAERKAGKGNPPAYKLSVNDLVIKAVALSLRDKPTCNVSWYDDAIIQYGNVDVSVAVATEGGLITPIIRNADQKTLPQISGEMKDLAKRARDNKLKPEEFQGGGFSISNLGMYGVNNFQAIINPPQACILAVGAGTEVLKMRDGQVKAVQAMNATLSVDHRAVDGALGAEFLQLFKRYMENPVLMFV